MGDVFRQQYRKRDGSAGESKKWYGQYTDHEGRRVRAPLSTDKGVARSMLADLVKKVERRRSGIEDDFTEAARSELEPLIEAYHADLKLRGRGERHRAGTRRLLAAVVEACGWKRPGDLRAARLDAFLAGLDGSARTKDTYRQSAVGFANWLVKKRHLEANLLLGSSKPEGAAVRRRRALTAAELARLFAAAGTRPLDRGRTINRGERKGQPTDKLAPATAAALEAQGRHNALVYRTAFYTGLRADELRSLWAGDLVLDGPAPRLLLPGERTKNGHDARLPLPAKLAADLAAWVRDRGIGPGDPVFKIPIHTAVMLRRDLAAAGIPYKDARGRVADFHSLRASLASHLNASGVNIVAAKNIMRHGTITLTADVYHDDAMDDLRGAVAGLPEL